MNRILLDLTRFQIWCIQGKYLRIQAVKLPECQEQEIVIYSGDKTLYSGQCTPFRKIIIREDVLTNENLLTYVLSHEMAHKRQWWSEFSIPLAFLIPIGLVALVVALLVLIHEVASLNVIELVVFLLEIIMAAILIAIPCAFSWLMELNADFQAIKAIGFQAYLDIVNNPSKQKRSLGQKVIIRMTHPPKEVTIRLWKRFHRYK